MQLSVYSYLFWLMGWALAVAYLALLAPFYHSARHLITDKERSGEAHGDVYESRLGCSTYVVGVLASAYWIREMYLWLNDPASSMDDLVRSILMMAGCVSVGGAMAFGGAFQLSLMWGQKSRYKTVLMASVIGAFIGGAVYPLCAEYLGK